MHDSSDSILMSNGVISEKPATVVDVQDLKVAPPEGVMPPKESSDPPMSNGASLEKVEKMVTFKEVEVAPAKDEIKTKDDSAPHSDHTEVNDKLEGDARNGTDSTVSRDLYDKLLERLETMEKKLGEIASREGEKKSEKETVKEPEGEKNEEEKEEEPFDVEKKIKYVPSEAWCLEECKPLWATDTSKHPLVISMKSTQASSLHLTLGSNLSLPNPRRESASKGMGKDMSNRVPDRVAIACPTLLTEVGRITGTKLETTANVLVRPFKILVPFQQEFAECLKEQEELCETLISEQCAKEAPSEPATKDSEDVKKEKAGNELTKDPTEEEKLIIESKKELKTVRKIVNGMKCLLQFMDKDLQDIMEIRREIKEVTLQEIAFEHLWHLFKPGDLVISNKPKEQAYRVLHAGGGRPFRDKVDMAGRPLINSGQKITSKFTLDCFYIDFNGTHYGPAPKKISISPYEGKRQITALDVIPITFLPDKDAQDIEETLVARGKKFVKLARVSHKKYKGLSLREDNFRHEELDSDVIIDFALAFKNSNPPYEIEPPAFSGGIIDQPTAMDPKETLEVLQKCSTYGCCEKRYVFDDAEFDLARRSEFANSTSTSLAVVPVEEGKLGRNRQVLLPYRVYGYVLLSRKWYPLDVDIVEDVRETQKDVPDGFNDLVLREEHKQIVRALVKTHARGPRSTASNKAENSVTSRDIDLVKGKGKGLIILLHGVPGVGKTSTAECVAANTNRPLFPITVGDIGGTTAKEVENNLESYFDLARKWGCVLLLDEADVFLGERTRGDIAQNSLVSVFLRVLEYYSGILILTTNRVGQFDEAIKSRIHISLYYPPLNEKSSLEIWRMNLDRLEREHNKCPPNRPVIFSRKEIMNFAKGHWAHNGITKTHWNGRQIKNAFQTAIALAEWEHLDSKPKNDSSGLLLEARHFNKVAEASARFDVYLASVRKSDKFNAREKKNRDDDYVDTGIPTETGLLYPSFEETKRAQRDAQRAKREQTPLDSDGGQSGDNFSEFSSYDTDEDFEAKKRQNAEARKKKEEQKRKKEEADKAAKRKVRELKKQQQREMEELKRREEKLQRINESEKNSDDSDSSV